MMEGNEGGYSTLNEKEFISGLGSFSGPGPYVGRRELLARYIKSCDLRQAWGRINRIECITFAQKELLKLNSQHAGSEV